MNPFLIMLLGGAAFYALRRSESAEANYAPGSLWAGDYQSGYENAGGNVWDSPIFAPAGTGDLFGDVVSGSESTAETYHDATIADDNLAAFLWLIRYAEGTDNERGYDTLFGYQYFDSATARDHPRRVVSSGSYRSDAAGAYQIMSKTWDTVIQPALRLPDFSPASQDAAAVYLLKVRGAYDDVINGRVVNAINKVNLEWASLPGSPYGQPVRTMPELIAVYESSLGTVA